MLQLSVATICCLAGAISFYLTSAQQKLLKHPPARMVLYCLSVILAVISLILLNGRFGPATSVFYYVTILMLTLTVVPIVLAYFNNRKKTGGKHE